MAVEDKRTLLEQRRRWLVASLEKLRGDMRRAPWLFAVVLLSPLAWWLFGGIAALFTVLCAVILGFTGVYIVWAHQREYEGELQDVRAQLRALGAPPSSSSSSST